MRGAWCIVSQPASTASGELLYPLLHIDRPLLDTNALPLLQVLVELLLNLHCHISDDRTRDLCNTKGERVLLAQNGPIDAYLHHHQDSLC